MKGRIHLAIHRALRGHAMRDELPQVPHGPSARGQALWRDVGGVDTAQVAASQGGAKIELTERAASRMAFGAVPKRIGQVAPPHPLGRIARGGIGQGILEDRKSKRLNSS